ncbi:MaoC family dehydratase [Geotalea uraniireducens]|uniref:MaoC family dehydratase n=1 Tax=Geotalea uraniireducens TaxID=351604 RepID=A0ABM8EQE8_9BACT|nr:MaoC family dehydratase [Geotalea uraniireducens]BDV44716.1 MaoC family dehydratase [Geotalea uraniireducens]
MSAAAELLTFLAPQFGREIHVGEWLTIDQERIDRFAEVTGDRQWIHIDPERARRESPYGTTVAHGFLTLSLLPLLTQSNHPDHFQRNYPGMRLRVNYGLNRVRFPAPVLAGSRVRARTVLKDAEALGEAVQIRYEITVEIDGGERPGCVAEQLVRVYP